MSKLPFSEYKDHGPSRNVIAGISGGLLITAVTLFILFTRTPSPKQPQTVSELLTQTQSAPIGTSNTEPQHQPQAPPPDNTEPRPANLPHLGATVDQLREMLGKPGMVAPHSVFIGPKILPFGESLYWSKKPDPAWSITATCITGRCLRIAYGHHEGRITDEQIRFLTDRNGLGNRKWTSKKNNDNNSAGWTAEDGTKIDLSNLGTTLEITLPTYGAVLEALKVEQANRSIQLPKL